MNLNKLMQITRGELEPKALEKAKADALKLGRGNRILPYIPQHFSGVAFIGEAPGEEESKQGKPFVGAAGKELQTWCASIRVNFDDCYLDNVYSFIPPGGSIDNVPKEELREAMIDCGARLSSFIRNNRKTVVVPLGNLALEMFTNENKITKHRGGIYSWPLRFFARGRCETMDTPIIPMLSPAAVLRNTSWRRRCLFDMGRLRLLLDGCDLQPTAMVHYIVWVDERRTDVNLREAVRYLTQEAGSPDTLLAIDIETAATENRITCVGFSCGPSAREAAHVSVTFQWPTSDDRTTQAETIRLTVQKLCESPCQKVLHNGLYDTWWLQSTAAIRIQNWIWDTLCMAHAWCPTDSLSLEYLTSILTKIPYYKDEGKDHFGSAPKTDASWEQLMTYCGKDTVATFLCWAYLKDELIRADRLPFYLDNYPLKFAPMLDMMLRGVRVDNEKRKQVREELLDEARAARDELMLYNDMEPMFRFDTKRDEKVWDALQTMPRKEVLNGGIYKTAKTQYALSELRTSIEKLDAKTVSTAKLQTLLYDKLSLPVQFERRANGTETPTVGDLTLRKLYLEYAKKRSEVGAVIRLAQKHNGSHKLAEFCYDNAVDEDGRLRFSLKFNPESGRFASSRSPRGRGKNSQNQPRDKRIRQLILPDKGHVLVKVDMSQVEARFCFVYTHDPELIELAKARPNEYDQHKENAVIIKLASCVEEVTPTQRRTAKHVVHGAQRNMQGATLADTLLHFADMENEELIIPSVEECDEMLEAYHRRYPAIRGVFFEETRRKMQKSMTLTNSWGRVWNPGYQDLDDKLMRRAYSFLLQSEAADLINRQGYLPVYNHLKNWNMQSRIMLHAHDELVLSCHPKEVDEVLELLQSELEKPGRVEGVELSVPLEYGLGSSWAVETEWKYFPSSVEIKEATQIALRNSR